MIYIIIISFQLRLVNKLRYLHRYNHLLVSIVLIMVVAALLFPLLPLPQAI